MSIRASERTNERTNNTNERTRKRIKQTNERTSEWVSSRAHTLICLLYEIYALLLQLAATACSVSLRGECQIFGIQVSSVSRYCLKCYRWRRVKRLRRCRRRYSDRLLFIFIVLVAAAPQLPHKSAASVRISYTQQGETMRMAHKYTQKQFSMRESFVFSLVYYCSLRAFFLNSRSLSHLSFDITG